MGNLRAAVLLAALGGLLLVLLAMGPEEGARVVPDRAAREDPVERPAGTLARGAVADDGGAARSDAHTLRGTVSGPWGPLWGAELVAIDPDTGAEVARTTSRPGGVFDLDLGARSVVDLRVVPEVNTGLLPTVRTECIAGDDLRIVLERGPDLVVHVAGLHSSGAVFGVPHLLLFREEDWRDLEAKGVARGTPARTARAIRSAPARDTVRFPGVDAGRHVLELDRPDWELAEPGVVPPGAEQVTVRLVPLLIRELSVLDLETGEPVAEFEGVIQPAAGRAPIVIAGANGRLAIRIPAPDTEFGPEGLASFPALRVRAAGYAESNCPLSPALRAVYLWSEGPPNLRLVLTRAAGAPWPHPVDAVIHVENGLLPTVARIPFRQEAEGVWEGRAPAGARTFALETRAFSRNLDLVVPASGVAEVRLVLPATGTLRIRPPRDVDEQNRTPAFIIQGSDLEGRTWRWFVRLEGGGGVPADGIVIEDVPAGRCVVGGLGSVEVPAQGVAVLEPSGR